MMSSRSTSFNVGACAIKAARGEVPAAGAATSVGAAERAARAVLRFALARLCVLADAALRAGFFLVATDTSDVTIPVLARTLILVESAVERMRRLRGFASPARTLNSQRSAA